MQIQAKVWRQQHEIKVLTRKQNLDFKKMLTVCFCVCLHICLTDTSLPFGPAASAPSVAPSIIIFPLKIPTDLEPCQLQLVLQVQPWFLNLLYRVVLSTEINHSNKMQAAALLQPLIDGDAPALEQKLNRYFFNIFSFSQLCDLAYFQVWAEKPFISIPDRTWLYFILD